MPISKKQIIIGITIIIVVVGIIWLTRYSTGTKIVVKNSGMPTASKAIYPVSALAGLPCEHGTERPLAVMMPSDPEARPLSAIGQADMVFEMPVTDGGVTRFMAVFQCNEPKEIGPIRSARVDYIPLVQGLNALYAHFGGEHTALSELDSGIVDNIDGLKYDGTVYHRVRTRPRPNNAYTNYQEVLAKAKDLAYRFDIPRVQYPHTEKIATGTIAPPMSYQGDYATSWIFDPINNNYKRSRGGRAELDSLTNKQVAADTVVLMYTGWSPINKDYIRVTTVGTGKVTIYRDGTVINGTWEKKSNTAPLRFYDVIRKEIPFAPGLTWVQVII